MGQQREPWHIEVSRAKLWSLSAVVMLTGTPNLVRGLLQTHWQVQRLQQSKKVRSRDPLVLTTVLGRLLFICPSLPSLSFLERISHQGPRCPNRACGCAPLHPRACWSQPPPRHRFSDTVLLQGHHSHGCSARSILCSSQGYWKIFCCANSIFKSL